MNYYVHPKFNWSLEVRRHERVVANHFCAGAVSYFANFAQVRHNHNRICRRFQKNHLRIWFDCSLNIEDVRRIDKIKFDIVIRQYSSEETEGAAVGIIRHDYMFTGIDETQSCINRCHPRSESKTEL